MRFSIVTICIAAITAAVASATSISHSRCNPNQNSQAKQSAAIKDFANLFLVQKNIQAAFDYYVPGEYINHNPGAMTGRQNALNVLIPFLATPGISITVASVFAGEGFGYLHYKLSLPGVNFAVMDRYRFEGTCIVEHWDVAQQITGNETNPIAFF